MTPRPAESYVHWTRTYVRFHGPDAVAHPYHGAYGATRLAPWASRLSAVLDAGHDVYAYFNNDWFGHAVDDATHLRQALTRQGGVSDVRARNRACRR